MDADAPHRSVRTLVTADGVVTAAGLVGDAVLMDEGRVVAVGQRTRLAEDDIVRIDYDGAWILPGFRDAHIHAVPYAALLAGCSLKSAASIEDLTDRLAAHATALGPDAPVVATRMDDESLAERRLPTRHDLDRAVPDRPAVIYRYCGHIAVANSEALARSGIDETTPDPHGGSIDRDADGRPTGVLRETAAGLVSPSLARGGTLDPDTLIHGLERLAALGITSIGAMMGYGELPHEQLEAELELWLEISDRLPITVHGIVITNDATVVREARRRLNGAGPRLSWLGVKRFADGSLGGHTAAMHAPFADTDTDTSGTLRLSDADAAIARSAADLGGMVAVHAIGDRAIDGVLDMYEGLIATGTRPSALRVEHVSVISPDQIERFARSGVIACVQPAFLASEAGWVADRLGPDRAGWLYPFRSMLQAGIPMSGSSDSPVEPPHPLWGMAAAIDRASLDDTEALSPLEALALFTDGAAHALREDRPLSPDSPADLAVVDIDVSTASADSLRDAAIVDTWVHGVPVEVDRSLPAWVD